MSTPKNDGGPAFPAIKHGPAGTVVVMSEGMTLRDWFAGQIVAQLAAQPEYIRAKVNSGKGYEQVISSFAEEAYQLADAMLAAREDAP